MVGWKYSCPFSTIQSSACWIASEPKGLTAIRRKPNKPQIPWSLWSRAQYDGFSRSMQRGGGAGGGGAGGEGGGRGPHPSFCTPLSASPCPPFISPIGQMSLPPFQGLPLVTMGGSTPVSDLGQADWMGKSNHIVSRCSCSHVSCGMCVMICTHLTWEACGPCKRRMMHRGYGSQEIPYSNCSNWTFTFNCLSTQSWFSSSVGMIRL